MFFCMFAPNLWELLSTWSIWKYPMRSYENRVWREIRKLSVSFIPDFTHCCAIMESSYFPTRTWWKIAYRIFLSIWFKTILPSLRRRMSEDICLRLYDISCMIRSRKTGKWRMSPYMRTCFKWMSYSPVSHWIRQIRTIGLNFWWKPWQNFLPIRERSFIFIM